MDQIGTPPPQPKLISCRVMIEELRPFLPEGIATECFGQMKEKFFPVTRSATSPPPEQAKAG